MDSPSPLDTRTLRAKKAPHSVAPPGPVAAPTTFFLRREKDMESAPVRGRKPSQSSSKSSADTVQTTPSVSLMRDSTFGVQSLEDTIRSSSLSSETSPSRSASTSSECSLDGVQAFDSDGRILSRKRKAGNRVHPTILAAGRRIISYDRETPQRHASVSASPASIPFTPTKSPYPAGSVTPSTPRSGSPKSFRLSDEDSVADDHSQAIASSSGEEDDRAVERTPQLVMPSLPITARRPFTSQGRQLGRARVMVVGAGGVGKTNFISSLIRSTEHIVYVDQLRPAASESSLNTDGSDRKSKLITEIQASTRPYPPFWTNVEHKRHRSNSISSGVLERNLTFIDTPGLIDDEDVERILNHVKQTLCRTGNLDCLSDAEIISLLSGDGGVQIDAVLYLFGPENEPFDVELSDAHKGLIRFLCKWTNFIPLISKSDILTPDALQTRRDQINVMLHNMQAEPYKLSYRDELSDSSVQLTEPLAVSSALGNDEEVIDASILMSSQYLPPLVPSELGDLTENLFAPTNLARMRHFSATKFVLWKREVSSRTSVHAPSHLDSPYLRSPSPGEISNGSFFNDPSKVMVPHSSSSYYRSTSPAISDASVPAGCNNTSNFELARHTEQAQPAEPFRQIRLAKWAQDLQRGLDNERRKYREMYVHRPAEWMAGEDEKNEKQALVSSKGRTRPARGRLGGDLGVIDPRDPLGVLGFGQTLGQRGFLAFQLVSVCGLLGAATYWVFRNWIQVQEFFGVGQSAGMGTAAAATMAERRHSTSLFDVIRVLLGRQT